MDRKDVSLSIAIIDITDLINNIQAFKNLLTNNDIYAHTQDRTTDLQFTRLTLTI